LECDELESFYGAEDSVLKEISESIRENRRDVMKSSNVNPGVLDAQPVVSSFMLLHLSDRHWRPLHLQASQFDITINLPHLGLSLFGHTLCSF
jgi:hypothetical protein